MHKVAYSRPEVGIFNYCYSRETGGCWLAEIICRTICWTRLDRFVAGQPINVPVTICVQFEPIEIRFIWRLSNFIFSCKFMAHHERDRSHAPAFFWTSAALVRGCRPRCRGDRLAYAEMNTRDIKLQYTIKRVSKVKVIQIIISEWYWNCGKKSLGLTRPTCALLLKKSSYN